MRCKQLDRMPVVSEWQQEVLCPQCGHHRDGSCGNASRSHLESPCPFDGVPLNQFASPILLSKQPEFPAQDSSLSCCTEIG